LRCLPSSPPRALPEAAASEEMGAWQPVEVSPREGVKQMGMPTMDGEEDEPRTSFRVPKGVTSGSK
jgi:hypothetical protein